MGLPLHFSIPPRWLIVLSIVALVLAGAFDTARAQTQDFAVYLEALTASDFKQKGEAIDSLAAAQDPRMLPMLQALLDGRLYSRKSDKRLVTVERAGRDFVITDVLTDQVLEKVAKRKLAKISLNNPLRTKLRGIIARLRIHDKNPSVRLLAVGEIARNITPGSGPLLRETLTAEQDPKVLEAMRVALALLEIQSADKKTRIEAIGTLSGEPSTEVRNRLATLLEQRPDGGYLEAEVAVREAAARALKNIDLKMSLYGLLETTFFGLSLGSVLVLASFGLAITFGVMGVINMAHGEMLMLGAYTTYVVQLLMPNHVDLSLFVAIPAAFLVAGLAGMLIQLGVIRYLYGRPLETLLATFGISLFLQQLVRSVFSPLNRSVSAPSWMSGSLEISSALSLTYNRIYILAFGLLVFAALLVVLRKTSLGLHVRAVSQNRAMAKAMGIRTTRVDALTFGLGSGIAGVAGVALSQLTNVGPNLGQSYIVDTFMVVVFGGVGNLWGTLIGGLSLGVANKFLEPYAGAVLAKILILVLIIIFIQKRPRGLFPQKGRAAES
ncbi:MAG: urea ABC transporter permease subunit UrtB [Gammaproteobacteria bacterium]